ncbi:AAA family ATPase [Desulfosarcina sp. OttesenSCG-928-G10]|nr:AAA family ATPase [Desulfosarcina sp. OttesenSCG-928-G10]MDL2320929.1 AAA family ATPase [Desulfosarcina sp. OttesenSCG-928-B08]
MNKTLPKPIKKQREVLYMPSVGHSVVLGTAGSGKTTLALYRAAYLSEPSMAHGGKTLLLTFNRTLVTYLKCLNPISLQNVSIENYHTFVRGYLKSCGKMSWNCICEPDARKAFITQAIKKVETDYEPSVFFSRPIEFFSDEIQWIFSHGISSLDDYVRVERVGRMGTNLSRTLRPVMYAILKKYVEIRAANGKLYDWDDIAFHARKAFETDCSPRLYKHIIIDEGQDFSPEMIRSLAAAIPEDGSLSFFGDVAQQIYGQRMSWRSAGLNIPQQWFFKENYRNTKQIAQLGLAISRMPFFKDIPDIVEPTTPRADGVRPTLVQCKDRNQQIEIVLQAARQAGQTQRVAILVKERAQENPFGSILGHTAIRLHRDLQVWNDGPGIYYGTYHSAKGIEFDMVIIPFLESSNLPDQSYASAHGEEDSLTLYGRLLYVAATRAKANLILLYTGELTPLLPVDELLYQRVTL